MAISSTSPWLRSTHLLLVDPMAHRGPVLTSLGYCRDDQRYLLTTTNPTVVHGVLGAGI